MANIPNNLGSIIETKIRDYANSFVSTYCGVIVTATRDKLVDGLVKNIRGGYSWR